MRQTNSILEDICATIGFTATMRLVALRPGDTLLVPYEYCAGSRLEKIIGESAMARLVQDWGGEKFDIPQLAEFDNLRLLPGLALRLSAGESPREIARVVGLTEQHVRRLRAQAESFGLMEMVLRRSDPAI
jgi:hypothetical protein